MGITKLNQNQFNILKNLTESPENLLHTITLTSQARLELENEIFLNLTIHKVEQWNKLLECNPWYSDCELIQMIWAIEYEHEFESTLGEIRNKLYIGWKKSFLLQTYC